MAWPRPPGGGEAAGGAAHCRGLDGGARLAPASGSRSSPASSPSRRAGAPRACWPSWPRIPLAAGESDGRTSRGRGAPRRRWSSSTGRSAPRCSTGARAHASWRTRVASAWTAFTRAPRDAAVRTRLLEAMTSEPAPPAAEQFLTAAQRTELRRRGHALEGRVVLEDVSATPTASGWKRVPLGQLVEDWNAGLRALVSRLERVPRPRFHVIPGHRHDEVSFSLDVRSDVDETRVSQVARRLAEIPGLEPDGTQLPPPASSDLAPRRPCSRCSASPPPRPGSTTRVARWALPLSDRTASYVLEARLDPAARRLTGRACSPGPIAPRCPSACSGSTRTGTPSAMRRAPSPASRPGGAPAGSRVGGFARIGPGLDGAHLGPPSPTAPSSSHAALGASRRRQRRRPHRLHPHPAHRGAAPRNAKSSSCAGSRGCPGSPSRSGVFRGFYFLGQWFPKIGVLEVPPRARRHRRPPGTATSATPPPSTTPTSGATTPRSPCPGRWWWEPPASAPAAPRIPTAR